VGCVGENCFCWVGGGIGAGGGGGNIPFGGPYCMIGRYIGCWETGGTGRGLGSLIAYITASKMCGSTVIVQVPSFVIVSFAGLFVKSGAPFFFVGFVQYFSKMPSLSHFARDRCSDSARTPL
jgi:hypothetical protein